MSFSYKGITKKCTSPSNEFLLQACGQTDIRTAGQRDIWTHIYPPLDNCYSPIISLICGPNNTIDTDKKTSRIGLRIERLICS